MVRDVSGVTIEMMFAGYKAVAACLEDAALMAQSNAAAEIASRAFTAMAAVAPHPAERYFLSECDEGKIVVAP